MADDLKKLKVDVHREYETGSSPSSVFFNGF